MSRLTELTTMVTPETHAAFKELAAKRRVSMSTLMREVLDAYLRGAQPLAAWLEREDTKEQHP